MIIIPAIDLKDGKAVRLQNGLIDNITIYGDAVNFAKQFEAMGARWLHLVDLDGAFKGSPKNLNTINNIRKNCKLQIQLGGGIRNEETIKKYIDMGIDRIILGSIAVLNLDFTIKMSEKYKIVIGIDAINGLVAINGWSNNLNINAIDFAKKFNGSNINGIICTDISKDGMMMGMNVELSEAIYNASNIPTIASGGFVSKKDINNLLKNNKIYGVIIGKAFYENKINLKELLKTT